MGELASVGSTKADDIVKTLKELAAKNVDKLDDVKAAENAAENVLEAGAKNLDETAEAAKRLDDAVGGGTDLDIPTTKPSINQGKDFFRNAVFKKPDIKIVSDAANQNFTYQELLELAEEYKKMTE